MQHKIVPYLRCPEDRGDMTLKRYRERDGEILSGTMVCDQGHEYQVDVGIPILRKPGYLRLRDKLKIVDWKAGLFIKEKMTEQQVIDMFVQRYDEIKSGMKVWYEKIHDTFYEILGIPDEIILDICSGYGTCVQDTMAHYNEDVEIIATEFEIFPLGLQRKKLERLNSSDKAHLLCTDVFKLPFEDNTFRYATGHIAFNATSDPLRAMQEAYRVMRSGGIGVTLTLSGPSDEAHLKEPRNTKDGYKGLLEKAGFVVDEMIEMTNMHPKALKEKRKDFLLTKFRK